ncbi:NIMA-interacting protein tinc [Morchella snyderi]|nr:NIMA-interacting protein tinc [Morchella snyderi]
MAGSSLPPLFLPILLILCYAALPTHAFGAGNIASISKIEGMNWRHGDIEDTLLQLMMARALGGKKFDSMTVKRIYFGNWLRDYSQAIDVGSLKYVEAPTIRLILWMLSFMTFGYGTGAFEVTEDRLGCYRPEEHIDNPKDYADNLDARDYDHRLRGPIDERIELAIDPQTGMKNYIANEHIRELNNGERMYTSAGLVRDLLRRSIELGRSYGRDKTKKADKYEALRLMGTGLHCLEDFSAHSNYIELALIEMGQSDVFPHTGSNTAIDVNGRWTFPLVTGTFGGVDFLHSVLGEFSDKATQSEIEQLEGTINNAAYEQGGQHSIISDLLKKLPIGGAADLDSQATELEEKSKLQAEATQRGEPYGIRNSEQLRTDIYPFLEWHDKIMMAINKALESIPGLTAIVEKLSEAVSIFVFSLIAPFLMPILHQVKMELSTGSGEVIGSSKNLQFIVFHDHDSSNPTHSMLSKDHFTNCLNEPAGKIASEVIKYVVPKLMDAWDDEYMDIEPLLNDIVGVFHHPAFAHGGDGRGGIEGRQRMFNVVQQWWGDKSEDERQFLRYCLSREGVQQGKNHKEGQHDSGHGCGAPIHRVKPKNSGGEFGVGGDMGAAMGTALEQAFTGNQGGGGGSGLGGLFGGLAGAAVSGYLAQQMGGGRGGGESRSSGFEEVRERGFGGEYGERESVHQRSYDQSGGVGTYQQSSYERPVPRDAAYLQSDSYGSGEGRQYYGASGQNESYGHGRNHGQRGYVAQEGYTQDGTSGYGRVDSFGTGRPYGEGNHGQESYGQGYAGGYQGQATYGGSYSANMGGYSSHNVSYSSHTTHETSSYGERSYESREHHSHSSHHGGEYENSEKVHREDSRDERGGEFYTENRW